MTAKADPIAFKAFLDAAPTLYTPGTVVKPSTVLDKSGERVAVIASAREEYVNNSDRLNGVRMDSFVNVSLAEKDMPKMTADEVKTLKGGR